MGQNLGRAREQSAPMKPASQLHVECVHTPWPEQLPLPGQMGAVHSGPPQPGSHLQFANGLPGPPFCSHLPWPLQ